MRQFDGPCMLKEYALPRFVFFNVANGNVTFLLATGGTKYLLCACKTLFFRI